jgi:tRNA nucleotidyltransferase (CCA-adding enzyme)
MNIKDQILRKIVPTVEENQAIEKVVKNLCAGIQKKAKESGVTVEVMLVGSIAKDTHLRGALDIDLFVMYQPWVSREKIKRFTLDFGKQVLDNWNVQYAEHPYIRGVYETYDVDIVPCYNVQDTAHMQSAVDRTPFHTLFIKEHLAPEQHNQVRLLKQFLKGIGCYSAEVKVQGFSGYLAELLVLKYGSFCQTLEGALNWSENETLSLQEMKTLKEFDESFVFIDPVDPFRNVAAALSNGKRRLFIKAARDYLINPHVNFFFPRPIQPWPLNKIEAHLKNAIGIELPHPDVIDDIIYSQVRKAERKIAELFKAHDFEVLDSCFHVNSNILLTVFLKSFKLSRTKIHRGPPEEKKEYVDGFRDKWQKQALAVSQPFQKKGRWWVEICRQYTTAQKLLEQELLHLSLGKCLDQLVVEMNILEGKQLARQRYAKFWTGHFTDVPSWQR